jgi:hypothetical protein
MYIFIYVCMCINMYIYIYIDAYIPSIIIHIYTYNIPKLIITAAVRVNLYLFDLEDVYTQIYVCKHLCILPYICVYIYLYVFMHICMYIHTYKCICT